MKFKLRTLLGALLTLVLIPVRLILPRVAATTGADLATLSELMKEVYDPVIEEQQNLEPMTWNEFPDGDDELGGTGWTFETKMGGNQEGIGARAEKEDLPTAGRQRYEKGLIYWKLCYGAFELSGPVMEAAKSNLRAFANARTEEIEGLTRDTMKDFNRQIYGDGTGVLTTFSAAATSVTHEVANAQYLRLNMLVDFWDATNIGTKNSGASPLLQITAISPNTDGTADVTFGSDSTAVAIGDFLIRHNSATTIDANNRTNHEYTGLQEIVDDGTISATFEGISRTTFPLFKGHVLDNSGTNRNLTLDLLQQAEDAVFVAANKRPDWCRMNLGQRRKFFDLVGPDKRYATGRIDGGYERLDYNGLELTVDVDAPFNKICFLTKSSIKKYSLRKFGLLDFDGLVLRQVGSQDLWRGYLGVYGNLGSKRPNCNAWVTDLVEPTREQWVG